MEKKQDYTNFEDLYEKYDYFLFDCDGVLYTEGKLISGSAQVLEKLLQNQAKKVFFLTNNACYRSADVIAKLKFIMKQHFENPQLLDTLKENQALTPNETTPFALLQRKPDPKVVLVGEEINHKAYLKGGIKRVIFNPVEQNSDITFKQMKTLDVEQDVDFIVIHTKLTFTYADMCYLSKCIQQNPNAQLIAGNIDMHWKGHKFILPDTGACLKGLVGTSEFATFGKPSKTLFDLIKRDHFEDKQVDLRKFVMFGDTILQDIQFARNVGIDSVLCLSGVTSEEDLEGFKKDLPFTYLMPSVGHGLLTKK